MTSLYTRHPEPAASRSAAATTSLSSQVSPSIPPRKLSGIPCRSASPATRLPKGHLAKPRFPSLVTRRLSAAFTLIELLIVIAIIALLAGLAFPALQGAIESGRKADARNDVAQIATAIKAYQLEYGRLPASDKVIKELTGENTRGIVFLEAKRPKGKPPRNGVMENSNDYLDSWGRPYIIQLDDGSGDDTTGYDNKITADVGLGEQQYLTTVLIKSLGKDGENGLPKDIISNVR